MIFDRIRQLSKAIGSRILIDSIRLLSILFALSASAAIETAPNWTESEPPIRFKSRDWADAVLAAASTNSSIAIEGGRLLSSATWDSTKTHLVFNTVYVPSGITLTISEGAIVKFCPGTMIKVEDGGKLSIVGASGNDVIHTAANDATVGEVVSGLGDESIAFDGIRLQSNAATFTDNGWLETRGFNFGAFPTVSVRGTEAVRNGGVAYIPFTLSGSSRDTAFSIEWEAIEGTAKFGEDYTLASGTISWAKSSEGTKMLQIPLNAANVTGEERTFTVRIKAARGSNIGTRTATVKIVERDALTLEWAGDWTESEPPIRFKSRDWADAVLAAASTNSSIAIEGGRLLTNTTWDSTKTHLVFNTVYVPSGITLTISEGTIVKFCPGTMIKVEDGGKLSIVGVSGNDVILTAANDATAGEVIAGLGEESFAFGGIRLQSTAATFTDNGWLETRGFNYAAYPSVTLNDSTAFRSSGLASIPVTISGTRDQTLTIDWVAVDDTAKYGEDYTLTSGRITWSKASEGTKTISIPLVTTNIVGATTSFKIKIVTARGANIADGECTVSIREFDTLNIESGSAESMPPIRFKSRDWADAVLAAASTNDAIIVEGGRLLTNTTWDATKTHLVFNPVYVPSGITLTISEGAVVKFCPGTMIKVEDGGKLNIVGASGNDVILTAANDATVGEVIAGLTPEQSIAFGGIRLQSTAATFTDNGWLETRGFNYGAYPSVTLHDATANRKAGMVYLPVTVGGTTRNQSFTVDWVAEDESAQFGRDYSTHNSGRLTWSKSGDGTKYITIPLVTTETAGSNRTFKVRFVVARGVNVTDGEATVTIAEFENGGITSMDVVEYAPSEASPEFTIDEGIGIQPIFLNDVERVQYSGKWQTYDKNDTAALRVTVESDNGVKILKETTVTDTGAVDLKIADYPVGCYTLKHEIINDLGETLATMSKIFSVADEEDVEFHGGTLTQNEVWSADKVHVVYQTVYVPSIYTLFIEPGAIVKFMTGTGIDISQGGALFANKIVFTHINDDTIGGDTLSDGYTVAPPMDAYTLSGNFTFGDDTELRNITQSDALTGTISANKMLSKGSTYRVTGTLTVASGATLTVPPGTVLKMEAGASIVVNSGATLNAIGTRAAPIIFTSIKDDSVSGDTNGDGDSTIPQPGDWKKIAVYGTANMDYCKLLYGAAGTGTDDIILVSGNSASVTFNNGLLAHGAMYAIGVESGHFYMTNSVVTDFYCVFRHWPYDPIVNCVIYDCTRLSNNNGQKFYNCIIQGIVEAWDWSSGNGNTYSHCLFWNEPGFGLQSFPGSASTLNGNIWGDPLFVDPDNGDFRIVEGSPCVDAADSAVASEIDYFGQPRVTITEQSATNLVGQLADIGICEVMPRDMTSDIDLVPQLVRADTNAVPGQLLFVKWEVGNAGGVALEGSWRDTVSLVSATGREVVLGAKMTSGTIAPGGSIFCSGYFTVPAVTEGEWVVKVNVNSYRDVFEGALGVNNAMTGDRTVSILANVVDPSVSREGVLNAGTPTVLKFSFGEEDENRMVKFALPDGVKVIWGFGFMPQGASQSGSTTSAGGNVMFRVPEGSVDVYVVLESDTSNTYEMTSESTEMVITGVSPNTLPSSGTTTLVISGAGFGETNEVVLSTAADNYRVQSIAKDTSGNLIATVDCSTLTAGATYGVCVESGEKTAALDGAVTVTKAEGKGELRTDFDFPEITRQGRVGIGFICFSNVGSADMPVPIYHIFSTQSDMLFSLSDKMDTMTNSLYAVGVSDCFPKGILKAGESGRIPIYFIVNKDYRYQWNLLGQGNELRDSVFPTWSLFAKAMGDATTRLNLGGKIERRFDVIYKNAIANGYNLPTAVISGRLINALTMQSFPNVNMVVCDTNNVVVGYAKTDEEGCFLIDGLEEDSYYLMRSDNCQMEEKWLKTGVLVSSDTIIEALPLANILCTAVMPVGCTDAGNMRFTVQDMNGQIKYVAESRNRSCDVTGLRDGEYKIKVDDNAKYYGETEVPIVIKEGSCLNREVSVVMEAAGQLYIEVFDMEGQCPSADVPIFLNSRNGKIYPIKSDANGLVSVVVPIGEYTITTGAGYSRIDEIDVEVVYQGEVSKKKIRVSKTPFSIMGMLGCGAVNSVFYAKEDNFDEDSSYSWDFNNDGLEDAYGVCVTNLFESEGVWPVSLFVRNKHGNVNVYKSSNAVRVFPNNAIEFKPETVVLDNNSGYEIVSFSSTNVNISVIESQIQKFICIGSVIVHPDDLLHPLEIVNMEFTNGSYLLKCKPTDISKAYTTLRATSSRTVLSTSGYEHEACKVGDLQIPNTFTIKMGDFGKFDINGGFNFISSIDYTNDRLNNLYVGVTGKYDCSADLTIMGIEYEDRQNTQKKTWQKGPGRKKTYKLKKNSPPIFLGPVPFTGSAEAYTELDVDCEVNAKIPFVVTFTAGLNWNRENSFIGSLSTEASCDLGFSPEDVNLGIKGELTLVGGVNVDAGAGLKISGGNLVSQNQDYAIRAATIEGGLKMSESLGVNISSDETISDEFYFRGDFTASLSFIPASISVGKWFSWDIMPKRQSWPFTLWDITERTPMPSFATRAEESESGNVLLYVDRTTELGKWQQIDASFSIGQMCVNANDFVEKEFNFRVRPDDTLEVLISLQEKMKYGVFTANKRTSRTVLLHGKGCKCNSDCECGRLCAPGTCQCGGGSGGGGSGGGGLGKSNDPNEMAGPLGLGDPNTERFVKPGEWMTYTVYFENMTNATAAAQEVYVTNPLSEWLDWSTFEMGEVSFGNQIDLGLSGKSSGTTEKRMDGTNWIVRTELSIEPDTTATDSNRQQKMSAKWYLRIVDPTTSTGWPVDPVAGFLPPNNPDTHCGEGHLTYRIKLRDDAPAGIVITNSATIVFDYNDPITTDPAWWNTVMPATLATEISPDDVTANEGESFEFKVFGGNLTMQSSVQVQLAYNTAAAADINLKELTIDGAAVKNAKFPLTLTWAAGEIGEKTISIPVAADKATEADEFFTLQLADPKNMSLGDVDTTTVTIRDPGYDALKAKVDGGTATSKELSEWSKLHPGKLYVRPLAAPATGGKVSGGALVQPGKKASLKATANAGYVFAGWYTNAACAVGQELTGYGDYRNPALVYLADELDVDIFARFIPVEEDYLTLGDNFLPSEITTNAQVSIYVPVESASLPDIKVSGLPSGLKFYAKETVVKATKTTPTYIIPANTIYGVAPSKPTAKPATVTVTVKNAGKYAITRKYSLSVVAAEVGGGNAEIVFDAPAFHAISVDLSDDFAGKVTGTGICQAGKKATVKAIANKGYVFSGWYDGESLVSQAASYAFTMPEEDVALYAKFVTAEEDAASIALSVDALGGEISPEAFISVTNMCGVALRWSISADALSQPTVAVSGLPSGLKFTAKDILKKGSKTEVDIPANTVYGAPTAESKLDAKTGLRKPSAVKFTVTTAGKSKVVYPVEMTILPLPDWAVGTFNGGGDSGQVSLTVAKTGKLSGKHLSEGLTWNLAADCFDSIDDSGDVYRATLVGKSGKLAITNEVGVACDAIGGYAESELYIAFQNNWKLEPWKTVGKPLATAAQLEYEDTASVNGEAAPGVITLKFASSGAATIKGSFVTGVNAKTGKDIVYSASGSAVLLPQTMPDENGAFEGLVFVYFPPKAGKLDGYVRCVTVRWTGEAWEVVE